MKICTIQAILLASHFFVSIQGILDSCRDLTVKINSNCFVLCRFYRTNELSGLESVDEGPVESPGFVGSAGR